MFFGSVHLFETGCERAESRRIHINFQGAIILMNPIQTITTTVGIIAILIGLLLPAVQR